MARFQFKLRRLLRVREIGEEHARAELAAALAESAAAHQQLSATRDDVTRAEHELGRVRLEQGPAAALAAEQTLPALLRRIVHARQRVERAERKAEAARANWSERKVEVRALDKLEERERARFALEERAAEDRVLQELNERRAASASRTLATESEA